MSDEKKLSELAIIHGELKRSELHLTNILPPGMSASRFALVAYSHVRKNKDLMLCDPRNIVAEVAKAAELGLDFSIPNEVSLVPFKEHKSGTMRCSSIPGYKGYAKLALQSGGVKSIRYSPVYSGDKFSVVLGSEPKVIHEPVMDPEKRGELLGFYALGLSSIGGMYGPVYMTVLEIEKHAKRYVKANFGPFGGIKSEGRAHEHFIAYGLKTVLLQLCKRHLPLSARGMEILHNDLESMEKEPEKVPEPDINDHLFSESGDSSIEVEPEPVKS